MGLTIDFFPCVCIIIQRLSLLLRVASLVPARIIATLFIVGTLKRWLCSPVGHHVSINDDPLLFGRCILQCVLEVRDLPVAPMVNMNMFRNDSSDITNKSIIMCAASPLDLELDQISCWGNILL